MTNQAYYMSCSLFKAGDIVSLEITGNQLGGDDSVTVNGESIGTSTADGFDIPKTVLTGAIEIYTTLGRNATVKVRYYDPAPVAATPAQAATKRKVTKKSAADGEKA